MRLIQAKPNAPSFLVYVTHNDATKGDNNCRREEKHTGGNEEDLNCNP